MIGFRGRVTTLFCAVVFAGLSQAGIAQLAGIAAAAAGNGTEPPANYRGPDTYGLCAYVAGTTTYYGNIFHVSSYFKIKAQQAMQTYAGTHAGGQPVKASHCYWSYKEADLATAKDADKRLLGLPGHSVNGVETGWVYSPGAPTTATAATTTAATANRYNSGGTTPDVTPSTIRQPYSAATAGGATSTGGLTSGTAGGGSTSIAGNAQQQVAGAKATALSGATDSVNSLTTAAVGGATSAMQSLGSRMFRKSSAAAANPANAAASASPANPANPAAPSAAGRTNSGSTPGLGFAESQDTPLNAAGPAAGVPGVSPPVEGLVADVSGKELILNIGQAEGVAPGTKLLVMHPQRVVKDPATGKVLRVVEDQLGEVAVTSVDASSSTGIFTGTGTPVVGDKVRARPAP